MFPDVCRCILARRLLRDGLRRDAGCLRWMPRVGRPSEADLDAAAAEPGFAAAEGAGMPMIVVGCRLARLERQYGGDKIGQENAPHPEFLD
jgi:hypothetical protein